MLMPMGATRDTDFVYSVNVCFGVQGLFGRRLVSVQHNIQLSVSLTN